MGSRFSALANARRAWEQELPGSNPRAPTHSPAASSRYAGRSVPRLRFGFKSRHPNSAATTLHPSGWIRHRSTDQTLTLVGQ